MQYPPGSDVYIIGVKTQAKANVTVNATIEVSPVRDCLNVEFYVREPHKGLIGLVKSEGHYNKGPKLAL
ncbi:hypothetical protein CR513_38258, partial [Mucuna pruriens]